MKDHVEIGNLTKFDAFTVNRDQVIDLEIWFKIHANVSNFERALERPPKPYQLLKFFISLVTTVKSFHATSI